MASWYENFGPWLFKTGISLLFFSYFAGIFFDLNLWETAIVGAVENQDAASLPWPKDDLKDQLISSLTESPIFDLRNKTGLGFQLGALLALIGLGTIIFNPKNFLYRTSKYFIYFGGLNYIGSLYSLRKMDELVNQAVSQMQIPDEVFQDIVGEILKTILSNILDELIYYSGVMLLVGLVIFLAIRFILKYPGRISKKNEKGE